VVERVVDRGVDEQRPAVLVDGIARALLIAVAERAREQVVEPIRRCAAGCGRSGSKWSTLVPWLSPQYMQRR
jgi:hypothetical protein